MKYRTALIAAVALVAICLFGFNKKPSPVVSSAAPKAVVAHREKASKEVENKGEVEVELHFTVVSPKDY